ncbi:hypothetical protein DPMN_143190 [Dreissena polymorpha]|uniref:Uncharacterized protein n=1 Tax=Dreissena polymorpha TaxID=45954 RepID=A0A9D4JLG8_DREPO|nr:hypothetical protein DPMN_143190 [Dreissena polymorpha]
MISVKFDFVELSMKVSLPQRAFRLFLPDLCCGSEEEDFLFIAHSQRKHPDIPSK